MKQRDKLNKLIKNNPKSRLPDLPSPRSQALKKIETDPLDHFDLLASDSFEFKSQINKNKDDKSIQRTIKYSGAHENRAREILEHRLKDKNKVGMGQLFNILLEEYEKESARRDYYLGKLLDIIKKLVEDFAKIASAKNHSRSRPFYEAVKRYKKGQSLFKRILIEQGIKRGDLFSRLNDKERQFTEDYILEGHDSFIRRIMDYKESVEYLDKELTENKAAGVINEY